MLECWKAEPKERPSFCDLSERLGELLQDYSTKSVSNLRWFIAFLKNVKNI